MKPERFETAAEVARAAADATTELLARRPGAVLVLPAGATPVPFYEELCRREHAGKLSLAGAHVFQLDEYVGVGPDDPRSFQVFLREAFLDRLERPPHAHLLDGAASDPAAEIRRHAGALDALGGADLAVLGCGRNGHVAFNEPGTRPDDGARVVTLQALTRELAAGSFDDRPVPTRGMTLGLAEILAARSLLFLVTGTSKANILAEVLAGPPGAERPASFLAAHGDARLLVDAPAARDLTGSAGSALGPGPEPR